MNRNDHADEIVQEFQKTCAISRAVYWDGKIGKFYPRSYSATVIALRTNEAFSEFKNNMKKGENHDKANR